MYGSPISENLSLHCDSETILMLYKYQVIPILDYACMVWDPHLKQASL